MEAKYGIGDKVRVINYGCWLFGYDKDTDTWYQQDMLPEIVGKEGIIDGVNIVQDIPNYSVDGIPRKYAWYIENQLEMINRNPNR